MYSKSNTLRQPQFKIAPTMWRTRFQKQFRKCGGRAVYSSKALLVLLEYFEKCKYYTYLLHINKKNMEWLRKGPFNKYVTLKKAFFDPHPTMSRLVTIN